MVLCAWPLVVVLAGAKNECELSVNLFIVCASVMLLVHWHFLCVQSGSDSSDEDSYDRKMKDRVAEKLRQKKKPKDGKVLSVDGDEAEDDDFVSPRQRELDRRK